MAHIRKIQHRCK